MCSCCSHSAAHLSRIWSNNTHRIHWPDNGLQHPLILNFFHQQHQRKAFTMPAQNSPPKQHISNGTHHWSKWFNKEREPALTSQKTKQGTLYKRTRWSEGKHCPLLDSFLQRKLQGIHSNVKLAEDALVEGQAIYHRGLTDGTVCRCDTISNEKLG